MSVHELDLPIEALGEFGLIGRIRDLLEAQGPFLQVAVGIGDDAACLTIPKGFQILLTSDSTVEERHFSLDHISFKDLGRRAMVQNISDIGAMGGIPHAALVSLCLRSGLRLKDILAVYQGLISELMPFNAPIVGGNITRGPLLELHITLLGIVEEGMALTRSGARPGDQVLVTGLPGRSAMGLRLLQRGIRVYPGAVEAFLRPSHRAAEARKLALAGVLHSMIDISDGLMADLGHICEESRVGAILDLEMLPRDQEMRRASEELGIDLDETILGPSDDYELLFTLDGKDLDTARGILAAEGLLVSQVGEIIPGAGIRIRSKGQWIPHGISGYDHLRGP